MRVKLVKSELSSTHCIPVSFLAVMLCYTYVRYYHWGKLGDGYRDLCITFYNCMFIYNYSQTKSFLKCMSSSNFLFTLSSSLPLLFLLHFLLLLLLIFILLFPSSFSSTSSSLFLLFPVYITFSEAKFFHNRGKGVI